MTSVPTSPLPADSPHLPRSRAAWVVVVFTGVVAAMHIWKLPTALPIIQEQLGISLVDAGILLGTVQVSGMIGGLLVSLFAEIIGMRRSVLLGLVLLVVGTLMSIFAPNFVWLLVARFVEGVGFLTATIVAPALIRRVAPLGSISTAIGFWSSFQGQATFLAVIASTMVLQFIPWQGWYWVMLALTIVPMILVLKFVPHDPPEVSGQRETSGVVVPAVKKIGITASSWKPWIAGLVFMCYTVQWIAIIGFLPTIYLEAGLTGWLPGVLTAVAGGANAIGAVISGGLFKRGFTVLQLVIPTFVVMALMAFLTFFVDWKSVAGGFLWQFLCVVLFSAMGSLIPSSLTRLSVEIVPPGGSSPAVMGLMQQIYSVGSVFGPALVAALAVATGGWQSTWWMNAFFSALGIILVLSLSTKRLKLDLR